MSPLNRESGVSFGIVNHFIRFNCGHALTFLFVGMDLQAGLDPLPRCSCFHYIADGAGGKSITPDEHGDIRLRNNESEADMVIIDLGDPELGLIRVVDKL